MNLYFNIHFSIIPPTYLQHYKQYSVPFLPPSLSFPSFPIFSKPQNESLLLNIHFSIIPTMYLQHYKQYSLPFLPPFHHFQFFFPNPKNAPSTNSQCNIDSNHCVFSQTVVYFRLPAFTPSLRCFLYLPENQENLQITKYGFARLITFVFSRSNPTKQMFNSISHTTRTFFFFFFFP